jgi:hypothetical protein
LCFFAIGGIMDYARQPAENHVRRDARNGVRGLLIYCADYRCSHSIAISGDASPDDARLSDIEERFTCRVCGKRDGSVVSLLARPIKAINR